MLLAGGIDEGDKIKTVQDFVSEKCRGSVGSVLPEQFRNMTVGEVLRLAARGDAAARSCKKLLDRDEYRK